VILIGSYHRCFAANCTLDRYYFFPDALHNGLSLIFITQGHHIIIIIISVHVFKNNNGKRPHYIYIYIYTYTYTASICNLSIGLNILFKRIIRLYEMTCLICQYYLFFVRLYLYKYTHLIPHWTLNVNWLLFDWITN